jgi:hypothetical protein
MMDAVVALAPASGLTAGACAALNVSRASIYRRRAHLAQPLNMHGTRPSPQRALSVAERRAVLGLLRAPRFADQAPAEVYASLLDEGVYLCSDSPALPVTPVTPRMQSGSWVRAALARLHQGIEGARHVDGA